MLGRAQLPSGVRGEAYSYEPISDAEWIERWKAQGRPEWALEAGQTSYEALRAGELDVVSTDFEKVTGRRAASIAEITTELPDEMRLSTSAAAFSSSRSPRADPHPPTPLHDSHYIAHPTC